MQLLLFMGIKVPLALDSLGDLRRTCLCLVTGHLVVIVC